MCPTPMYPSITNSTLWLKNTSGLSKARSIEPEGRKVIVICWAYNPGCLDTGPNVGNWDSVRYWPKKGTKNSIAPCSIPFPSVLHQNKALYNFHKRG